MTGLIGRIAGEASGLVEELRRSVVVVHTRRGQGSGTIWRADGWIVTNHHVVRTSSPEVELEDGRVLAGSVVAGDPELDLALLRVPADGLPAARRGDSRDLRVGELIVAVGSPFGVPGTATLGVLSGIGAPDPAGGREVLYADVDLAPGSSGGPLADTCGRVVGIATMVISPGVAVAIPAHVVDQWVEGATGASGW